MATTNLTAFVVCRWLDSKSYPDLLGGWHIELDGCPPKNGSVQDFNSLGNISEVVYDEERTIQRHEGHGCVGASGKWSVGFWALPGPWNRPFECLVVTDEVWRHDIRHETENSRVSSAARSR